ncbi:sigma 54-interacting transcriptional regulator [Alicyclobacillus macrosporangiidus]|uniref:sigma 54-interacting transcriptional regulator n=1 Tax=Alicyclobacillus macrosporangiidus TaxID=392015 RepID=UPI0018CC6886|nr:sigma 54-interacting transcriptional regulator [Alicyclobacillus macrosporangiidus]
MKENEKAQIMIVAPYEGLARMAEQLVSRYPFSVGICVLDSTQLEKDAGGVAMDKYEGIRVFVSRGGTANYLRKWSGRPVIEIPVTPYDVLYAISQTARLGYRRIGIVGPANLIVESEHFVHLTDLCLRFETCDDVTKLPQVVRSIVERTEVDAIVGDRVATQLASQLGLYGQLLESGESSLRIALDSAVNVLNAQRDQQVKLEETRFILNVIQESVIATDRNGRITMLNSAAEHVIGRSKEDILGTMISESITDNSFQQIMSSGTVTENALVRIRDKQVVLNHLPIFIDGTYEGSVGIFQEVQHIQNTELSIRKKLYQRGFLAKNSFSDIVTHSPRMRKMIEWASLIARSDGTVLIHGETGTGKELFAQSIHNASSRRQGPFVSVNCAAVDGDLLNSELFGYEEGAFTGAARGGRMGLFEMAHGGTIFLDEISETSLAFQAKLLRVIQEREIRRVGGTRIIPVDVRIICATNRDLVRQVQIGQFREDLLYRLNVLEIHLPPLRERQEDIIPLAISFLRMEMRRQNRELVWENEQVFTPLKSYRWPGNVRELQNFAHRLVVCCPTNRVTQDIVEQFLTWNEADRAPTVSFVCNTPQPSPLDEHSTSISVPISDSWDEMEAALWEGLLRAFGGDKEKLCQVYHISRSTLWRKLKMRRSERGDSYNKR